MPVTIPELAAEIVNDPQSLGYAALVASGSDRGIADRLNLTRATISIKRPDCTPAEILEAIDVRDFAASPAQVNNLTLAGSYLESITQFPTIRLLNDNGNKSLIRKNLDRLVNDTNGSQSRLDAVAVRVGSRAEQLFGFGAVVTSDDVSSALRGS